MDGVDNTEASIQVRQCPLCKVPIRRNLRYNTIINRILADVEEVKKKVFGNIRQNKDKQARLEREYRQLPDVMQEKLSFLDNKMSEDVLSQDEIGCIENTINFVKHIIDWNRTVDESCRGLQGVDEATRKSLLKLKDEAKPLHESLLQERLHLSDQQLNEYSLEITRFDLLETCIVIDGKLKSGSHPRVQEGEKIIFDSVLDLLKASAPLTKAVEEASREIIAKMKSAISGLGISEKERIEIVKAMKMEQGHWFKCPNGHVYAIGDCGGATVESRCPECGCRIGGQSHALRTDNRFAPEMDHAAAPAWPGMAMNRRDNI